jgi:hypothetical protein
MAYTIGVIDPATEDAVEPQVNPELLNEPDQPDQLNEVIAQVVIVRKSKHKGPNLKSRLLCPECFEILKVEAIEGALYRLVCGHSRPGILPTDKVSIEHMLTTIGRKLFPAQRDDEATSALPFDEDLWRSKHK